MAGLFTLAFRSTYESVDSASDVASRWLGDQGISRKIQDFAHLAIEELATNCIKYGYEDQGEHVLEISLAVSEEALVLTFKDDGRSFNPLTVPAPDFQVALEERPAGGLGIYLLRRMSDRLEYAREGNKNRVTLHKALSES